MQNIALPLIDLQDGIRAEKHLDGLFSENDLVRSEARKWLKDNADIGLISKISARALAQGPLSTKVARDVNKVLTSFSKSHLGSAIAKISSIQATVLTTALSLTFIRAVKHRSCG